MNDKRRLFIIIISVLTGTFLSVLLILAKKGKVDGQGQLINFVFSLAIVIGIGIFLSRIKKRKKQ